MAEISGWLVNNLWPVFGLILVVLGTLFGFWDLFSEEYGSGLSRWLGFVPGAAMFVFGLWVKGVHGYSPYPELDRGILSDAGLGQSVSQDLEAHWILFGLVPLVIVVIFWFFRREPKSVFIFSIGIAMAVMLAITVFWMQNSPLMVPPSAYSGY